MNRIFFFEQSTGDYRLACYFVGKSTGTAEHTFEFCTKWNQTYLCVIYLDKSIATKQYARIYGPT